MKEFFSLILVLFINYTFCQSQNTCKYEVGDILYFNQPGIPIKLDSSLNGKLITVTDDVIRKRFELEAINENTINGFLKVRLFIGDSFPEDTLRLKDYFKFNNIICWVDSKSINYNHGYPIGIDSIPYWTENIDYLINLRTYKYCKYYPEDLAQCYQQRGIGYYNNKEYSSAVYDLSKSIEVFPSYKIFNFYIITSYYYRAYAKRELSDYVGAVNDYNIAIKLCYENSKSTTRNEFFPCKICSERKEGTIEFVNGQECCYEHLICDMSYCNIMLKKYQTALTDLNLLLTTFPKYGYAYYMRGQLRDIMNDTDGGCKDLSRAGELGIKEAYDEIKKRCNKE